MSKVFQVKPKRLKRSNGTVLTPEMVVTVTTMQHTVTLTDFTLHFSCCFTKLTLTDFTLHFSCCFTKLLHSHFIPLLNNFTC